MNLHVTKGVAAALVSVLVAGMALAGETVTSGLKVGETVGPFQVDDVTGPNKGSSLCYRCQYGESPVVCIFARKTSESLAGFVKQIDEKITENTKLKSFVVIMPKKGDNPTDDLRKLAEKAGIKNVPLTVGESPDGPPSYEVSKDADITVLMWTEGVVKVNHAFKGDLTDKDRTDLLAEIPKILTR